MTSFVGRRTELAEVKRRISDSRLVTLVGPGGVGKTRLALRTATGLRRGFRDGVWWVELDRLADEALVAPAIAAALGLREAGPGSAMTLLGEYLADRQLLLVLDNCEHLLDTVAKIADELLRGAGDLRILATSRERFAIPGEVTLRVPPLAVPDPRRPVGLRELAGFEAVTLFVDRAASVDPGFVMTEANRNAVAEICLELDGLPLAVELAAVRSGVLTPVQIRDRLSHRLDLLAHGFRGPPDRQHTLRACIDWSHALCTAAEQRLWARLSVFAGDADLELIEAVCGGDPLPDDNLLDLVASLVDKSILTRPDGVDGGARYRMLESIREYGRERLVETGEDQVIRRRHRDCFRGRVGRAEAEMIGPRQADWLRRLDRELPDLRAALEFCLAEPGEADVAVELGAALMMLWIMRGRHSEGAYWLGRALAAPGDPTLDRVKALYTEVALKAAPGDVVAAAPRVRQLRELATGVGDTLGLGIATAAEATLATARGEFAAAAALHADALAVFRSEGDAYWQVLTLTGLQLTQALLGDVAGAADSYASLLEICRPRGESLFSGFAAMALGIERWRAGDVDQAAVMMADSARLLRNSESILVTSWCLEVTAWVAERRGQAERAARLLGAAAQLAGTMGSRAAMWPDLLTFHDECERRTRAALGDAGFRAAGARGRELTLDEAVAYALGEDVRPEQAGPADDDAAPGEVPAGRADPLASLTPREREVAALVAEGLTNREIAARLVIAPRTAEGHVENIMMKLGCTSRVQVAMRVSRPGP